MSNQSTDPVSAIAEQTLADYQFGHGVSVAGPARWGVRQRRRLMGVVPCRFRNLPGIHDIHFRISFDADGAVVDALAYEGVFATPLGKPGKLPGDRIQLGPDGDERDHYADLDLWQHPETGLVWIPERMKGKFQWDKAQRMPGHMNNGKGHRGFHDWRIPTANELHSLYACLSEPVTAFDRSFFGDLLAELDGKQSGPGTVIWGSDHRIGEGGSVGQGVTVDLLNGRINYLDADHALPILVVRDPCS